MESTKRAPAPGRLRLVQQYVNSVDLEKPADLEELDSADAARQWFETRGLWRPGEPFDDADRGQAIAVREALRDLAGVNVGDPMSATALRVLTRAAEDARFTLLFETTGRATLEPGARGVAGALGRLLAIVHQTMEQGTWERLKTCPADRCRWAFYDQSKNQSGTWCLMETCGNRRKARVYRTRRGYPNRAKTR